MRELYRSVQQHQALKGQYDPHLGSCEPPHRFRLVETVKELFDIADSGEFCNVRMYIGPPEAEEILTRNIGNRPKKCSGVRALVRKIKKGTFQHWFDDEWIKFSAHDGYLMEGQHKMGAIMETGERFGFLIGMGRDVKNRSHYNSGVRHSVGDEVCRRIGSKKGKHLTSAVNFLLRYLDMSDTEGVYDSDEVLDYTHGKHKEAFEFLMSGDMARQRPDIHMRVAFFYSAPFIAAMVFLYAAMGRERWESFVRETLSPDEDSKMNATPNLLRAKFFELSKKKQTLACTILRFGMAYELNEQAGKYPQTSTVGYEWCLESNGIVGDAAVRCLSAMKVRVAKEYRTLHQAPPAQA